MFSRFLARSLATLALGVASIGPAGAVEPFKFGLILPMTGAYSQIGAFVGTAFKAGVKEVNMSGGILGRPVELVLRDDASTPSRTLLAAKELVDEQKVDFLYPEGVSPLALAVLPFTTERKMVTISGGSAPDLGNVAKFPYSFQLGDTSLKRAAAVAAAVKQLGGKKVGVLVSAAPAQATLGEQLKLELPKYGLELAGYKQFAVDTKDLTSQLQSLKDAGADIVAFDGVVRENIRVVMGGMQTLDWKARVVTEPGAFYGDLTEQMPASTRDQFFSVNYRIGTVTKQQNPELEVFLKILKEYGPVQNLAFSANARDTLFIVKWALETAKAKHGNINGDSVRDVMERSEELGPPPNILVFKHPRWSKTEHMTTNADYSEMWSIIKSSAPVDGRYAAEAEGLKVLP